MTSFFFRTSVAVAVLLAVLSPAAAGKRASEGWQLTTSAHGVQRLVTPGVDREWIEVEDTKRFEDGAPTRFAVPFRRTIAPSRYGTWDEPAPGLRRWRLEIASPDALSLNLGLGHYHLPEGAALRILDASGASPFRAFTAADNEDHGQLWTPIVPGDSLTLELTVPAPAANGVSLQLTSINHGYRGVGETPWFAKSGSCNIDVICPQGDGWRNQMRSSAVLAFGGTTFCSGVLLNNAENDGRGFLLTAHHCGINSGNAASLVAYWNYFNSTCRPPATSGNPGDGSFARFNTGAILRARRTETDFALVEFDDPIDPAFELYFSGFDARDQATVSAVGIHHPNGEEMRISFENQPTRISSYAGSPPGSHLQVADWDLGTTEPGSSGSPLYSPEKRVIGQLHGGGAACGNDEPDYYGRFAVSWSAGDSPASRLRDWLDPNGTGTLVVDGRNQPPAEPEIFGDGFE